jgi:hypothetical protein
VLLLNKSFESLLSITTVLIALWIVKSNYSDPIVRGILIKLDCDMKQIISSSCLNFCWTW